MNRFFIWILVTALGAALTTAHAAEPAAKPDEHGTANVVNMDAAARAAAGIVIAKVGVQMLADEIAAPGEVLLNTYTAAKITPRIAAQVVHRHARLGDRVAEGQRLVTLSSVELAQAQGELLVAEREWQRVRTLGKDVVSERRYTEADVARKQARARALGYGMTAAQIDALVAGADSVRADGSFVLLAPRAGTLTTDDFIEGELIEPGRVLFEIADESVLWIEARLGAQDAVAVKVGQAARVHAGDVWLDGRVIQMRHTLDEQTRTRGIRIEVNNRDDILHPGEFVEARIATNGTHALAIPATAVVLMNNAPTVFTLDGDALQPTVVQTGKTRGAWTELTGGLVEGDEIAVENVFQLKSTLLKSQIGDEH
ncbi:MAG: efflux RND transporter periplasmic adaptor subunit [Gammaproteobacteria bacterium]|nr:efflux RND transporter periplasmic adaptor subunit [Gammaproteobacteria bacterium]